MMHLPMWFIKVPMMDTVVIHAHNYNLIHVSIMTIITYSPHPMLPDDINTHLKVVSSPGVAIL